MLIERTTTTDRTVNQRRQYHVPQHRYRWETWLHLSTTTTTTMKKALTETQTLRAGCSKAKPKIFAPPQTPFLGAWDGQNLISWRRSLPSPTDPVWWKSMHAISSYHGNRPRNNTHPPQTGPITIHCAAKLSAQCNNNRHWWVTITMELWRPHTSITEKSNPKCNDSICDHNVCLFVCLFAWCLTALSAQIGYIAP